MSDNMISNNTSEIESGKALYSGKNKILIKIFFIAFVVFFCFSVLKYLTDSSNNRVSNDFGNRKVFYFSMLKLKTDDINDDSNKKGKSIYTEIRAFPKDPVQGEIQYFVDELLLGPITNRYQPFFSLGTRAEFCFVQKNVLYVGLSRDALLEKGGAMSIKDGSRFFKMNILKNFGNIDTIEMFIDGKQIVYDM